MAKPGCVYLVGAGPADPQLLTLKAMIHGRDRDTVLSQIDELRRTLAVADVPYAVLFSRRRFKQRGARYGIRPREQVLG
jgi:siroheme synthase